MAEETKQQEQSDTAAAQQAVAGAEGSQTCTTDELLERHCPRYFYDKDEKIFPVDLNQYCADKSEVPGVNGVAAPSKDGKKTWLIYMNYYMFDGGIAKLGGRGGHPYDLEIVVVEVRNRDGHISGVFYGPHSSHEHFWIRNREDLKAILGEDRRPQVYVSSGKHASYPVSGKVIRLFGLGTDQCTKPREKPRPFFALNEETQDVDSIDGKFAGPKTRITRDWSVAPGTRVKNVKSRRAVPPRKQIAKELGKLKFW